MQDEEGKMVVEETIAGTTNNQLESSSDYPTSQIPFRPATSTRAWVHTT
jgi:hypothetical protein